jgi:uncharacterized protein
VNRRIDVKKTKKWSAKHPTALHLFKGIPPRPLDTALYELAKWVREHGLASWRPEHRAARDLLLALPPRTRPASTGRLQHRGEDPLEAAKRVARALDGGVLAIQGPPGSGKTHDGARLIVALAREGKRVGVTATSHKVVRNLLDEVLRVAQEERVALDCTHKTGRSTDGELPAGKTRERDRIGHRASPEAHGRGRIELKASGQALFEVQKNEDAIAALVHDGHVVGGVAWLWAAEEAEAKLDHLFIDEAGQMSLARVLQPRPSTSSLLGDPQRLQQPQRGARGPEISALSHLLHRGPTSSPSAGFPGGDLAPRAALVPSPDLFTFRRLRSPRGLRAPAHRRPDALPARASSWSRSHEGQPGLVVRGGRDARAAVASSWRRVT